MALCNRTNLKAFSLLNHCYCKKFTISLRLKSRNHTSISSNLVQNNINKQNVQAVKSTQEAEILMRRNQACRSLLIQVSSVKSYNDLHKYCLQFGNILSMHHYKISPQHNYILIEFAKMESIHEVMSNASFINTEIIPVKSSVLWFRKAKVNTLQKNNEKVPLLVEDGCRLLKKEEIAKLLYNAKSISGQIIVLYEALKLTDLEIRLRFHTAHHLEQYFSGLFHMKVLPFGSSVNGFGRKRCDLDLVLIPDDDSIKDNSASRLIFHSKSKNQTDKLETKLFLQTIADTMHHFIPGVLNIRRILEARVPIIKFRYDYTNTECDLSATNMTAVYMTELLNLYGELDWRVRPLVIAIRMWANSQQITSNVAGNWITNFPLTLLVLFYLQQKKILPSLKTLKMHAMHSDVRYLDGIDCTFLRDINKLPYDYKSNQDTLDTLLFGFFEYYSTFDFQKYGICIREGALIQKPTRSALHITNPLEIMLNVSKNVNLFELNRIISKLHDAIYMLETVDKSNSNDWGIMALLKANNHNMINLKNLNSTKEQTIKESKDHAYEISDGVSEVNIDESKAKKEEMV